MELRKDYVLVSSDSRNNINRTSTTDFTVSLSVPLENVVKTDIVQIIMEYNVANIVSPNNAFVIEGGLSQSVATLDKAFPAGPYTTPQGVADALALALGSNYNVSVVDGRLNVSYNAVSETRLTFTALNSSLRDALGMTAPTLTSDQIAAEDPADTQELWVFPNTPPECSVTPDNDGGTFSFFAIQELVEDTVSTNVTIAEGLYTPGTLAEALADLLPGYTVQVSTANMITLEKVLTTASLDDSGSSNELVVTSATLRGILGLAQERLRPTFNANNGEHGTFRWTFPRPVRLSQTAPYLLLQSRELGNQILTATGDVSFYRLLLVDTTNGFVSATNNRVDTYLDAPRRIKDIDLRVLFPDKTVVNNRGGSLTLLLEVVRSM